MKSRVQLFDALRGFFVGSSHLLIQPLAMLALIETYSSTFTQKVLLGCVIQCGLLLSIPVTSFCSGRNWGKNKIVFSFYTLSALCILLSLSSPNAWVYIIFISLGVFFIQSIVPIFTENYSAYNKKSRGRKFATTAIANILGILCFSWISRKILGDDIEHISWIFLIIAFSMILAATSSLFLSSNKPSLGVKIKLRDIFSILAQDKLFSYVLLAWFILGSANLWLAPFRVNLLREARYGFVYSPSEILVLIVLIPESVRLLCIPLYSILFDRINFIALRILLNVFFALNCLLFFSGGTYPLQVLAMVFHGLAMGGGTIAWNLWVTKIAPQEKVSSYMSIHAGLTGVRAVSVPFLGIYMMENQSPELCGYISAFFIFISILMFIPLLPMGKKRFAH